MAIKKRNLVNIDDVAPLIISETFENQCRLLNDIKADPNSLQILQAYTSDLITKLEQLPIKKNDYYLFNQIYILLKFLAYLEDEKGFYLLIRFTKFDLTISNKIFYDTESFLEDIPSLLCCYTRHNWKLLKNLIEDPSISLIWKTTSIDALFLIAIQENDLRKPIVDYLKTLLQQIVNSYDINNMLTESIIINLNELHPKEALEEIREAYGRFLLEEDVISIDDVLKTFKIPQDVFLKNSKQDCLTKEDQLKDINFLFQDDEKEINDSKKESGFVQKKLKLTSSRNEPCPCGSNKKYKKCCAITSTDPKLISALIPQISYEPYIKDFEGIEQKVLDDFIEILTSKCPEENIDIILPMLIELEKKHSNSSMIYSLIDSCYFCINQIKKSFELLDISLKKFPNDLIWKVKYGEYLFRRGEYDKFSEFFNNKFTLQELYPEKDAFSISDIELFFPSMVRYFVKIKKINKAILYLHVLKEFSSNRELIKTLEELIIE
jgi:hypothetical protein